MTRIIAGRAGGRTLRTPPGSGTRPTSDRVREALFSALAARDAVDGAVVLDLYAGSGALGLEALSRGAAAATFVESDRRAAAVVKANLADLALSGSVVTGTAAGHCGRPGPAYDLVLIDPPYDVGEEAIGQVLTALVEHGRLRAQALVVVERSTRSPEPSWPDGLVLDGHRRYGETTLWYAVADPGPDGVASVGV